MEYFLSILLIALVFAELVFLIDKTFKKDVVLLQSKVSSRFVECSKASSTKPEKQAFSSLRAILFCCVSVLILKAIQLLICFIVTGSNPFLQSTWQETTDIPHYIDIAKDGYVTTGENSKWIVFFPLYPYILKVFALITKEYYHTGCALSMIFFAAALFVFYKDTYSRFDETTAKRSVIFCCLCPTSFFAMLPMSEGLFILLCACFLYFLHKKYFLVSSLFGLLAALTRSAGFVLALPLVIALFKDYRFSAKFFYKAILYSLIVATGTIIYLFINYHLFGNPFYFSYVQKSYWHQSLGFFGNTMKTLTHYALTASFPQNIVLWVPQIITCFFTLAIIFFTTKRDATDGGFSFALFIYSFSATWLLSAPRYMLPILPCYNDVAIISRKSKAAYFALIAIYAICSIYLLVGFLLTGYVY